MGLEQKSNSPSSLKRDSKKSKDIRLKRIVPQITYGSIAGISYISNLQEEYSDDCPEYSLGGNSIKTRGLELTVEAVNKENLKIIVTRVYLHHNSTS